MSGPIRWQVLDMFKTSNGRHPINMFGWMNVTHGLVCGLSGSRAVCQVLMRSHVCIDVRSTSCEWSTAGQVKTVSPRSTACSFCDRSANVLSVSYTVHIHFVHYTSVTRRFVDRSLSVTCLVRMRSLKT